ncbi:MAG TPA: hypothetical protein VIK09_01985 [Candidatus Humimicrobiaceae bacterium]|jgi:hypothetical protein
MEAIKNFFISDKFKSFWINFYNGFQNILVSLFGKIKYEPIKVLLTNPWFWIIIIALLLLFLIFRRR